MSNSRLHPLFRAAFDDLRDGNAALARAAAKGPLQKDGSRMSYLRTRDDDDPYYMSPEEEKQMEADAEVERLHAEVAQQAIVIAELAEALMKTADECDDWDAHHIPLTLVTAVKKIAQDALKKAGKL